jgi:hypothetical protein
LAKGEIFLRTIVGSQASEKLLEYKNWWGVTKEVMLPYVPHHVPQVIQIKVTLMVFMYVIESIENFSYYLPCNLLP